MYTSVTLSPSAGTSDSLVEKKTRVPSVESPAKLASCAWLPPVGPTETSLVTNSLPTEASLERSKTSRLTSVSPETIWSTVEKTTTPASAEFPS